MSDTKISALPDGGAVQSTDEFVAARAGTNVKIAGAELSGGGSSSFHGWAIDYDDSNGTQRQKMLADLTALDFVWNLEYIDTDGFHSGSDAFVTIPAGLGGVYEMKLVVVTGNGNSDAEVGSRFVYFTRNLPTFDVIPGYWQFDDVRAGASVQGQISIYALLEEGDTVGVQGFIEYATEDIFVGFDKVYHQDTFFMGRYIGPLAT